MAKLRVNKIEAARRQIETAIRMFFSNEDPVAIHTLVMAPLQILRNLASKRDVSYVHKGMQAAIKPGMEKKFWNGIHGLSNFLKHADEDPNAILDNVDEKVNDTMLFLTCLYYRDLGHQFTPEMRTFFLWYTAIYPKSINDSVFINKLVGAGSFRRDNSRQEQLAVGKQLLQLISNQPRRYRKT